MRRRLMTCSIGWWVGPSSPTPMESCVHTKVVGTCDRAARRGVVRM